ncbi:MAG: ABC transporter permease [Eubacteriales bacterium]|nr:ABC transporter permease [Eubacteriales bacterium]
MDYRNNKSKEPLIHMTKRKALSFQAAWGIRLAAILAALIVCGVITMIVTGLNPLGVYVTMFSGAFGTQRRIWILGKDVAILLCISLALTPAFRMRFWNLGGEGQILMGALATAACMIKLGQSFPGGPLIVISMIAALGAGALWALIPALCKARWNTNETLFTLMMNYVATQLVAYFVIVWEVPKGSGKIGIINQSTEAGWLPVLAGNRYLLNILCVAFLTIAMYIYLTYSKQGYEISVVGESVSTARYVGIKVGWTIVRTLLLSGAICGLTGFLLVAGTDHTLTTTLAGGQGFTAVMVAWLAKFNPLGMVLSSLLLVFLSKGAGEISTIFTLNQSYGDILTGIILFFIIGSEFFIRYRIHFRKAAQHNSAAKETAPRKNKELETAAHDSAASETSETAAEGKEGSADV